eukprot:3748664-Pyramimonas_sp.AAC.1
MARASDRSSPFQNAVEKQIRRTRPMGSLRLFPKCENGNVESDLNLGLSARTRVEPFGRRHRSGWRWRRPKNWGEN